MRAVPRRLREVVGGGQKLELLVHGTDALVGLHLLWAAVVSTPVE